ncbi:MAG: hypothetical protein KUG59_04850 [Parvibaculaceae bacterium]|nr:hypothetical protein [Parvibaculaceae bacterium]
MIVIIQCAAKKNPSAGYLRDQNGRQVSFVADPERAPLSREFRYARPDDIAETGATWRTELLKYNETPSHNPFGLLPAWQLYMNPTYKLLASKYGFEQLFILSAGWGLISAKFLTPVYDITFSGSADAYKRRRQKEICSDLCMLPDISEEPVVFFGGKDYVSLFCSLTVRHNGARHVFYNSQTPPEAPGCVLRKYTTTMRTNWHYKCAQAFVNSEIQI